MRSGSYRSDQRRLGFQLGWDVPFTIDVFRLVSAHHRREKLAVADPHRSARPRMGATAFQYRIEKSGKGRLNLRTASALPGPTHRSGGSLARGRSSRSAVPASAPKELGRDRTRRQKAEPAGRNPRMPERLVEGGPSFLGVRPDMVGHQHQHVIPTQTPGSRPARPAGAAQEAGLAIAGKGQVGPLRQTRRGGGHCACVPAMPRSQRAFPVRLTAPHLFPDARNLPVPIADG